MNRRIIATLVVALSLAFSARAYAAPCDQIPPTSTGSQQLNAINACFATIGGPGGLPGGATIGQFIVEGASIPAWYSVSGDVSCSTVTPGLCTVTNAVSFLGTKTDGSNSIKNYSVNGAINPATYGEISSSTTTGTGSITSGTATLTLGAAGDWANGQGIAVPKAGAATGLSTPAQATVVATCPSGACGTAYTYQAVALDSLCGSTAASVASASVSNNASLDRTHFNTVTVTPVAAVASYLIFRGNTPVGVVINSIGTAASKQDFIDYGQSYTVTSPCLSATPPVAATSDALYTTILSGGGTTTLTLAANAGTTATSQTGVAHDDAFAINSAIASFGASTGGVIKMPSNQSFTISQPVIIGAAAALPSEPQILGDGSAPPHFLASAMMQGLPVIKCTNCWKPRFSNFVIAGTASAPPIAGIELRVNNPVGNPVGGSFVGEALIENVSMDTNSPANCVALTAAPTYDLNNAEDTIRNLTCNATHAGIYIGMINALDEHIEAGFITGTDAAIYLNGGSFDVTGSNLGSSAGGWMVDAESGTYNHDISLTNPHFLVAGGLLRVAAAATGNPSAIQISGADSDVAMGGNSDGNIVEMNGTQRFSLAVVDSHIGADGIANNNWAVSSNARNVMLIGSHFSMTAISGNMNVFAYGNHFASACPTSTLSGIWSGADNAGDNGALCLGFTNNQTVGNLALKGSTSGTATVQVPAVAGTPTITLPTTNGTAGQLLTSDGGAGTGYTWTSGSGGAISNTVICSITGTTAGTATCYEPFAATAKKEVLCTLSGYENTTVTAQTCTYSSLGTAFAVAETFVANTSPSASSTLTTLTLPASMGATLSGVLDLTGN